jgi:hypothetical protein
MAVQVIEVKSKVSKEGYEVGQGTKNIVAAVKTALDDGWQPGQDIPAAITALVANLGTMIQGIDQMDDEAREELEAFVTGLMLSAKETGFLFYKKPQPSA